MIDPSIVAAFETIYRNDSWGNGSGPGSMPSSTIEYRAFLERFIRENAVRMVTDLGCGDWQFSRLIDWGGVEYTGFDVVASVVEANRTAFARPGVEFRTIDDIDDLPGGDLLISKEVLQHLPTAEIHRYLAVIRSRYRFALLTNAIEPVAIANGDITPGDWRPLRLDQPPFDAAGATVMIYFPQSGSHFWRNGVFLMIGDRRPTPAQGPQS